MGEKMTGYLLLTVGLTIMVVSVVNIFLVFTNKAKPFEVFNVTSLNSSGSSGASLDINDLVKQLQGGNTSNLNQVLAQPKLDILPPEVLNKSLNLTTHFFLMSFLLGFGYKLASLGG